MRDDARAAPDGFAIRRSDDPTPEHGRSTIRRFIPVALLLSLLGLLVGILVHRWRRHRAERLARERERRPPAPLPPVRIQGLSKEEAAARYSEGQDNAVEFRPRHTRQEILRETVFTVFNASMLGLCVVQFLLGRPLDGLASLGAMALNIGINVLQQLRARRKLEHVEQETRPQATVIRDGTALSVDPSAVVLGDALVVGPGDPFVADGELISDGQILVDASMLGVDDVNGDRQVKQKGDHVFAGSFCARGRAIYEARRVGDERFIASLDDPSESANRSLTPLQSVISSVLYVLLALVAALFIVLVVHVVRADLVELEQGFFDAMSLIFSLAPSGLFFMIVVGYAVGTIDLAKVGAVVYRSQSVESLANVKVLCMSKTGVVTGTRVELETLGSSDQAGGLVESRVRQILGDYARSSSSPSVVNRALLDSFDGTHREVREVAPFLSLYGWNAVVFDDDDLRGVYVLGDPELLEPHLAASDEGQEGAGEEEEGQQPGVLRRTFGRVAGLFKRQKPVDRESAGSSPPHSPTPAPPHSPSSSSPPSLPTDPRPAGSDRESAGSEPDAPSEDQPPSRNPFRRAANWAKGLIRRSEPESEKEQEDEEVEPPERTVFLFAYRPDLCSLHDDDGQPRLPADLIPLCRLRHSMQIRPDTVEVLQELVERGVDIKVLSAEHPDQVGSVARQVGLGMEDGTLGVTSGPDLAAMPEDKFARAVLENDVFAQISPEQKARVVRALREQGQPVAMLGDGVDDVTALRQADLAITSRSGQQAALSVADIVLLKDSLRALLDVLDKGQRILHGVVDTLELNLTQVLYLALLVVMTPIVANGLPYRPSQGSLISIATLALPSVFLSLWAQAGAMSSSRAPRRIAHFVWPAGITISMAALVVYILFLNRSGQLEYAQLAVTYALVGAGLLLVVFLRPPIAVRMDGDVVQGDRRPTRLVLVLLVLVFLIAPMPLAQWLFKIDQLQELSDYLIVGMVLLVWSLALHLIWRLMGVRRLERPSHREVSAPDRGHLGRPEPPAQGESG
jgi:magnesium-transporting ATPase (P-type)